MPQRLKNCFQTILFISMNSSMPSFYYRAETDKTPDFLWSLSTLTAAVFHRSATSLHRGLHH